MASLRLAFQREIYTELVTGSGLLVLGEGLGAWEILEAFVETYASPKFLVLLLGLDPDEEQLLLGRFTGGESQLEGHVPFSVIRNDTLAPERVRVYAGGGVISVTSRIMLADLLLDRLPCHLTTGICLMGAARVTENCLEAFILHLFRQRNQTGFIKGFSERAEPFTSGFNQLEKSLKWLQVKDLFLYPRFHVLVKSELDAVDLEVSELQVGPSARSRIIQTAIVDLTRSCLRELVKLNPALEVDMDTVVGGQLDAVIRQQLEPSWHQLGFRTRQLVSDLATMKTLLTALYAYDAAAFLKHLETVLQVSSDATWIVLDAANTLIAVARERVINAEVPPKWAALVDLLQELQEEACILLMADNEAAKAQLEAMLRTGPRQYMAMLGEAYALWKGRARIPRAPRWAARKRKLPTAATKGDRDAPEEAGEEGAEPELMLAGTQAAPLAPNVVIRTYDEGQSGLLRALKPSAVVMFTQNLAFIRSLEMHAAAERRHMQVFSLYHRDSAEEQAALLAIRREKNAFETLIKAKAELVIPEMGPADDEAAQVQRGASSTGSQRTIVVDMRELRAALPFVLHRTGAFRLVPETIAVGDYLLTPDCAVERKSIPDLVQSLASGRLFTQVEAMCRSYKQPMLLIEFDDSKRSFSLLGLGDLRADIGSNDLLSKLILLLIHFPSLRLIWSSSLQATAEIFGDLMRDQPHPVINEAALPASGGAPYNLTPRLMLESMPGVNQQNLFLLMNACNSIRDLCNKELAELQQILGPLNGRMLFDSLHIKPQES